MIPAAFTTATAAAATALSQSTVSPPPAATTTGSPTSGHPTPGECSLLGPFAIIVQLALGALALLSLVYKRWRERPQRPVKIWFFDASKQVFGSALVHGANVFMSMLTSGKVSIEVANAHGAAAAVVEGMSGSGAGESAQGDGTYVPNPCSFYLLNLAIDTTIGIPILIVIVRLLTRLVAITPFGSPPESIQSGNYGTPPNAWWWLKQSFIYFGGLMGMKVVVLIMFMMLPWLPRVGDWALGWTEGNEKLQIIFVMLLFPLIMNALQYYIIDSYIKKKDEEGDAGLGGSGGALGPAGPGRPVAYEELPVSGSDESDESEVESDEGEDDRERKRAGSRPSRDPRVRLETRNPKPAMAAAGRSSRDLEYDPTTDGDSQTVIGSSSSHISSQGVLPKQLLPTE
ncbi:vacuolar membrane protein-domain-containing protein [Dichotomopilus funicola]|uniref:Vacuolar membrane protein-domain-containing protein n=1 Tax=Dichotomopilus funicola TaxID=1934379 RepID=A0AAN6UZF8_9PEZI|nr:vacuolar membrane protein-domain-containing protein [Dichotomopilus funicola]